MEHRRRIWLLVTSLALAGCDAVVSAPGGVTTPVPDSGSEPGPDAGGDAGTQPGPDGGEPPDSGGPGDASIPDAGPVTTPGMVLIPAGPFWMGCNSTVNCYADEEPYRQVTLSAFEIDKNEVTRAEYRACVNAGVCGPTTSGLDLSSSPNHPVYDVSWPDAAAFCGWKGKHLPSIAQWERAARGTQGDPYSWGSAAAACGLGNFLGCVGDTTPVGSFPAGASAEGALDLMGNVWEWTADYYSEFYYRDAAAVDPTGPATGPGRVFRGGAFSGMVELLRPWLMLYPDGTTFTRIRKIGVRCAK